MRFLSPIRDRTGSEVGRSFAQTVGDGAATSFAIAHGLGTRDVVVQVYQAATPFEQVWATVRRTTIDAIDVVFATAPTTGQYRVVVQGRPD